MLNHYGNGLYVSNMVLELRCLWSQGIRHLQICQTVIPGKEKYAQTTNAWMSPEALPVWFHLCLLKNQKTKAQRSIKNSFYSLAPTETADSNWDQQNTELKTLVLFLGGYLCHWEKSLCWNAIGMVVVKCAWQRWSSSNRPHTCWNVLFLSLNWVVSLTVPSEAG